MHTRTPQEARIAYQAGADVLEVPKAALARVEDLQIPTRDGAQLPARLYAPSTDKGLPVLLYTHGGGWRDWRHRKRTIFCAENWLAWLSGAAVLSVDYRLAPEHLLSCCAATMLGMRCNGSLPIKASALNLDTQRIAVGGDSAGGKMAAVYALQARDAGVGAGQALALQLLIYPGYGGLSR